MSASATTESVTTSPAEDVTAANAPTEQLGSEPLADTAQAPQTAQTAVVETAQPVYTAPAQTIPAAVSATADRDSSTQTLSIIAFALSIAAVVSPSFVLLPIASLVLGIIALARKPRAKGFALTSVIISGTMLAFALLLAVGAGLLFGLSILGFYAG
jgi:hypothetical protein